MDQGEQEPTGEETVDLGDGDREDVLESLSALGNTGEEENPTGREKEGKKPLRKPIDWDARKRSGKTATEKDEEDTGSSDGVVDGVVGGEIERHSSRAHASTTTPKKSKRHNWPQIATDFIEGIPGTDPKRPDEKKFLNLREIAELHGPSYQAVRARASKERWTEKKEQHALQVMRERQKARTKNLVSKSLEFDDDSLKAADIGMKLITTRLGEIAQEVSRRQKIRKEALEKIDAGIPLDDKSELYSAINYKEVEGLGNALGRFQEIGRRALGTDIDRHELSGPGGAPLDIVQNTQVNIQAEITRDDPERVAAILASMQDADMLPADTVETILAEVVEEGDK